MTAFSRRPSLRAALNVGLVGAAIFAIALIIWQGVTAHGTPDPTQPGTSSTVAFMDIGVLVFREGLEFILVLSAITVSLTGSDQAHRRPVAIGAGMGFVATLITWFIAIEIVGQLTESIPALELQAATGLVAVIVLLVIMNWFFHNIYWGGWIRAHTRRRKALFGSLNGEGSYLRRGLILLGFTSLYREGFEVVLFLQSYNLRVGSSVVLKGALLGLFLSGMVAVLTFLLQQHLPYRKMLISTGILLGVVLEVMVGEQAQEMQLAHWISTTDIGWLTNVIPARMGMWFAVFPTYEGWLLNYWPRPWSWALIMPQPICSAEYRSDNSYSANATAVSSSLSQVALNNQSLVLSIQQNAPSLFKKRRVSFIASI